MLDLISGWSPSEVIGLVGVLIGMAAVIGFFVWLIALAVAHAWRDVRLAELEGSLKRDFLSRGMSVEQVERLLRASREPDPEAEPVNERKLEAELASLLVQYEVSSGTMEQVVQVYQGADPSAKKAVYDAVGEMLESGAEEDQILAAVRTLCRPSGHAVAQPMAPVAG